MQVRPTTLTVDLDCIADNVQLARRVAPASQIYAVVKANGYGHGILPVARALDEAGIDGFGVALVEEGAVLRQGGISRPIIVWGGALAGGYDTLVSLQLTAVVSTMAHVEWLARSADKAATRVPVHIEVDTGMARLGVSLRELPHLLQAVRQHSALRIEGLMSHLAVADMAGEPFNEAQLAKVAEAQAIFAAHGVADPVVHVANSPGTISLGAARATLVRCGLMLYGLEPMVNQRTAGLRPALRWTSALTALHQLPAGASVSYGRRWFAARDSVIGTVPVGYADGYPRSFSNRAHVLVRGRRAPVVGTVCMDMCMVDLTEVEGAQEGDEVVLVGQQQGQYLGVDELARWADTISYEIICGLGARVPRVYVRGGRA